MPQRSSEQLRREAEQSRAQIADTLEELRTRITPGQVVDQLVDYAGDTGAGEFFRNLGRQAVNNPVPVALMGAGLAWLMLGGKGPRTRSAGEMMDAGRARASEAADALGRWRSGAEATSRDLKNKAADWASQSADAVRSGAARVAEKGKELGASISEGASHATSGRQRTSPGIADESMALFGDANSQLSGAPDEAGSGVSGVGGSARQRLSERAGAMSDKASGAYSAIGDKAASAYGTITDTAASATNKAASAYDAMSDRAAAAYDEASEAAARAAAIARQRTQAMTRSAADASRNLVDFCKEQPMLLAGLGLAIGAAIGAVLPGTKLEDEWMGETSDEMKARAGSLAGEQYERAQHVAERAVEETREAAEKAYEETKAAAQSAYEDVKEEAKAQSSAAASDLSETAQENVTTAPTLPEETAGSELQSARQPHEQR